MLQPIIPPIGLLGEAPGNQTTSAEEPPATRVNVKESSSEWQECTFYTSDTYRAVWCVCTCARGANVDRALGEQE